jgi:hypothetical protein
MTELKALKDFKIKNDEPNFLMGTAGNGISTKLQTEIFGNSLEDIYYLNYINFAKPTENKILVDIANSIIKSTGGQIIEISPEFFKDQFDIFKRVIEILKKSPLNNKTEVLLIFDEFNQLKDYSNAFFFTLDKILSLGQIFENLEVTSVLISDEFIDTTKVKPAEGMGKMIYHYFNFFVIPAPSWEEFKQNPIKPVQANLNDESKKRLYELTGGNPSLIVSILDTDFMNLDIDELLKDYEVEWKLTEFWDSIGESNRRVLKAIASGENLQLNNRLQANFLEITKLVNLEKKNINPELIEFHAKKLVELDKQFAKDKNIILVGDTKILLQEFSPQLSSTFKLFYENANQVVTREQIAEEIWGEEYLDKYSDYAIDKLISKLRSQLDEMGLGDDVIKTKKGVGYYLELP